MESPAANWKTSIGDEASAAVEWLEQAYDEVFEVQVVPWCGCGYGKCTYCNDGVLWYRYVDVLAREDAIDEGRGVTRGPECLRPMVEFKDDQEGRCYPRLGQHRPPGDCWCFKQPAYYWSLGEATDDQLHSYTTTGLVFPLVPEEKIWEHENYFEDAVAAAGKKSTNEVQSAPEFSSRKVAQ